jgi:hypothetical protein
VAGTDGGSVAKTKTEVLVNVFAGSPKSVVEMQLDGTGEWLKLKQVKRPDPYLVKMKELEAGPNSPPGKKLPKPIDCPHLWRGLLPADLAVGVHVIRVRTTDMFGQAFTGQRIIRVVENARAAEKR